MEQIPTTTIGLIAVIFIGFFALVRYVTNKQGETVGSFLDYIQKKNGHMERIAEQFSEKVGTYHESMTKFAVELAKVTEALNKK